ncbi:MAG: HPr family phosphocarrier protein, partial [Chloroflexota bacterium]
MRQLDLILPNPTGLHARPAKVFVNTAKQFKANIRVQHGAKKANAKSVISVLTLGVEKGGQIRITVDGPDEDEALAVLKQAVETGLGDDLSMEMERVEQTAGPAPGNGQTSLSTPAPIRQKAAASETSVAGIPASAGVAIGPLYRFKHPEIKVDETAADPASEKERLQTGIDAARAELIDIHQQAQQRLGQSEAAIFEAHLAILDDPSLVEAAHRNIDRGQSAAVGWQAAIADIAATLAGLQDEMLAARAADIRDVGQRILRALTGAAPPGLNLPDEPVILIAAELTPSDTVTLDPQKVLGFCTADGGANGHTASLARALG